MSARTGRSSRGGLLGALPCLLLWLGRPASAAPALEPLLQKIEAAQRGVRTMNASFVQHNRVKLFRQEVTSSGRLLFQRAPAALRWEYSAPDPSTLLLIDEQRAPEDRGAAGQRPDGGAPQRRAYLMMPGQKVRVFDLDRDPTLGAIFEELSLWLGQGALRDAQGHYDMSAGGSDKAPAVVLVPRPASPLSRAFARVELRLDPRTWLLRGLLLVERGGDEKEIVFTSVERNAPLAPALFQPR